MPKTSRYQLIYKQPDGHVIVWENLRAEDRRHALRLAIKQYFGVLTKLPRKTAPLKFEYEGSTIYFVLER